MKICHRQCPPDLEMQPRRRSVNLQGKARGYAPRAERFHQSRGQDHRENGSGSENSRALLLISIEILANEPEHATANNAAKLRKHLNLALAVVHPDLAVYRISRRRLKMSHLHTKLSSLKSSPPSKTDERVFAPLRSCRSTDNFYNSAEAPTSSK